MDTVGWSYATGAVAGAGVGFAIGLLWARRVYGRALLQNHLAWRKLMLEHAVICPITGPMPDESELLHL